MPVLPPRGELDNPESLVSVRLAFDLLNGSWRGWHSYVYYDPGHPGNEVGVGLVVLPLFALFDSSLLVASIVPMIASAV